MAHQRPTGGAEAWMLNKFSMTAGGAVADMWPFKKKTEAFKPPQKLEEAIEFIAHKWQAFSALKFKDEVPFDQQVLAFMTPALEGLLKRYPEIGLLPTEVVTLIFANGILEAGTHSPLEIQDALGIPRASE